jgi:hypothetical protein
MQNLIARQIVEVGNLSAGAVNETYLNSEHVAVCYECNNGAPTVLVFEYKEADK